MSVNTPDTIRIYIIPGTYHIILCTPDKKAGKGKQNKTKRSTKKDKEKGKKKTERKNKRTEREKKIKKEHDETNMRSARN